MLENIKGAKEIERDHNLVSWHQGINTVRLTKLWKLKHVQSQMVHCYKLKSKETDIFMEGLRNRFSTMIEKQPINDDTDSMGELQFKCLRSV